MNGYFWEILLAYVAGLLLLGNVGISLIHEYRKRRALRARLNRIIHG